MVGAIHKYKVNVSVDRLNIGTNMHEIDQNLAWILHFKEENPAVSHSGSFSISLVGGGC